MARRTSTANAPQVRTVRCAIYTRKSTEEGLEQEFNSLDAQREAAEAYITSQKHEGWVALDARFDDGGFTGGNMERPALARLLAAIEQGKIDCVVVYKVDRLSRSLVDFARIMETFENHDVSFVSVTQAFNTTTSMGRLTLNILLSFAQFEREIISERIRDKVAAAKRKGKHTGGMPILGYDIDRERRRLIVNADEAKLVRHIFRRFCQIQSGLELAAELNEKGHRTKAWTTKKGRERGGQRWHKGHIYRLLNQRKYIGEVVHNGSSYPGEHDAIVARELWDEVQRVLAKDCRKRGNKTRSKSNALLRDILRCGHCDCAMGISYSKKKSKEYRYYLCVHACKSGRDACPVRSVAADSIEGAVIDQLRAILRSPEVIARTYLEAKTLEAAEVERLLRQQRELDAQLHVLQEVEEKLAGAQDNGDGGALAGKLERTRSEISDTRERIRTAAEDLEALQSSLLLERDVIDTLSRLDPIWEHLFPAEQARVIQLLVNRVTVHHDAGINLELRGEGLRTLVEEMNAPSEPE